VDPEDIFGDFIAKVKGFSDVIKDKKSPYEADSDVHALFDETKEKSVSDSENEQSV